MRSTTSCTRLSGADAPAVTPTTSAPSSHSSRTASAESTRWAGAPSTRAVRTSALVLDELSEPTTRIRSHRPLISRTAAWRLVVA